MKKLSRLLIYGCGLVGGSLAISFRNAHPDLYIEGVSRSQDSIDFAVQHKIIDKGFTSLEQCSDTFDVAIIATPIAQTPQDIARVSKQIKSPCIISDVASVKHYIEEKTPSLRPEHTLVLGHPMAGSDKVGVRNANDTIMKNATYILVPTKNDNYTLFKDFLTQSGFTILEMDAKDHDFRVAYASHLPYLMACLTTKALLNLPPQDQEKIKPVLAKGFADSTRVSGSDPSWALDITQTNKDAILNALENIQTQIQTLKTDIQNNNTPNLKNFFTEINHYQNGEES